MLKKILIKLFAPKANTATAGALAERFGLELRGDKNTKVSGVAPIMDAVAGQLAFYSDEKNSDNFKILPIEALKNTRASVILVQPHHAKSAPKSATLLITDTPRGNIVKILGEIYKEKPRKGIHKTAVIERGVHFKNKKSVYIGPHAVVSRGIVIGENVSIGAHAFIGENCRVGAGTVIYDGVHIENSDIGDQCVLLPGCVIGKDGFGFTVQDGKNIFIPHVGRVVLGDRVSIGSCSVIERGLLADTTIDEGTKIGNLVQIAHGVKIGRECFIVGGNGFAGGVIVGDRVMFGGHTAISNKVVIGDGAQVAACSAVFKNIPDGVTYMGFPAVPAKEFLRMHVWLRNAVKK